MDFSAWPRYETLDKEQAASTAAATGSRTSATRSGTAVLASTDVSQPSASTAKDICSTSASPEPK